MRRFRRGFTIIEVSLFLAITGLLFLGVTLGVQNSMRRQRYNDSVQSFAEFLRSLYSEVMNVQSAGNGRSDDAIYGKLVTFNTQDTKNGDNIFSYDVIGKAKSEHSDGSVVALLNEVEAKVFEGDSTKGIMTSYKLRWGASLLNQNGETFKGAILIARHPNSGTVYTISSDKANLFSDEGLKGLNFKNAFEKTQEDTQEDTQEYVDFCISSEDWGNNRADVRVKVGASNSSGVEVLYDSEDNKCK